MENNDCAKEGGSQLEGEKLGRHRRRNDTKVRIVPRRMDTSSRSLLRGDTALLCAVNFFLEHKSQTWHKKTGQIAEELPRASFWSSDIDLHIHNIIGKHLVDEYTIIILL